MASSIHIPSTSFPPGTYSNEVLTPVRANGARITVSRDVQWPVGAVFSYQISERQRNGSLNLLTGATEPGGQMIGKGGVVNPPLVITLTWPPDADRDLIRFEVTVLQTFTTAITVDFI